MNYVSPQRSIQDKWLIMCFSTPFIINSPHGILRGESGDFIVNRPLNYYWHTSVETADKGFVNSWCHIYCDGIEGILKKYEIYPDTIYHTVDYISFTNDLKEIGYEYQSKNFYSEQLLALLFEKMIVNLARQNKVFCLKSDIKCSYLNDLIRSRKNMLANYKDHYTIDMLAKQINISNEYFLILYKKLFNISPLKDLYLKRMSVAKMLLLSTDLSINMIANSCGYTDSNYFSRIFKKFTGVSPRDFRK